MKAKKLKLSTFIVSLGIAAFTFSACQTASTSPSSPTPGVTEENSTNQEETKLAGGTVRTTLSSEPDNFDPHLSAAADTEYVMHNVFEGLIGVTPEGQFIPRLAKDYSISEDGLTYTFEIREGVTFHNGAPVTLEDVLYSYQSLAGLNGHEAKSSLFRKVVSIEALSNTQIAFTLSSQDASFLSACMKAVVPANYTDHSITPIGTGPFVFRSYSPGQKVILDRYDDYYDATRKASIDTIEFNIMTDPSTILLALKGGQLDFAQVDSINAPLLEGEFTVISHPQNMVQLFALNHQVAPLDQKEVRMAINYAIDKDLIVSGIVNGYGTRLYTNSSPVMGIWHADLSSDYAYDYNPELAKEILNEAGYVDGFDITAKVPSNYQTHVDTAQLIKDQLADVGITLNIELVDWGGWLEQVYTNRDYETTVIAFGGKVDPHQAFERFESDFNRNFINHLDPTYDSLLEQGLLETDAGKRALLYHDLQEILAKDAMSVFIMDPHLIFATVKNLHGYTPYSFPYFDATLLYYTNK
jgi:peptide/nickel transport system substrate-binding protein